MNKLITLFGVLFLVAQLAVQADIVVPGADGSDCDLVITQNTVIDLSLATTADWEANYNILAAADPDRVAADFIGKGVYDAEKWAVVFRYTDVTIAAGATVTFVNHPSRAPVVWLVSGNVDIQGTVSLDGQNFISGSGQPEPGPGGFRGGAARTGGPGDQGHGFGPGGGTNGPGSFDVFGGAYGSKGSASGNDIAPIYGNPRLLPLIGGSGGTGHYNSIDRTGGAGGGAILIAAAQDCIVDGAITANGGGGDNTGAGSGGGIRFVCDELLGSGQISAIGGSTGSVAGVGRVRAERRLNVNALVVNPGATSQFLVENETAQVWLPGTAPTARIVSLAGAAAPEDPRGEFVGSQGPDLIVANATPQLVIETTNLPSVGSEVKVRITRRNSGGFTVVDAVFDSQVSADPLVLRWTADVPISNGNSVLQVRIVAP